VTFYTAADGCSACWAANLLWSHKLDVETVGINYVKPGSPGGVVLCSAESRFIDWRDPDVLQLSNDGIFVKALDPYPDMIDPTSPD